MKQVFLLTGKPGTGKTSLIKQVVAGVGERAGGFYTEEIRDQGVRLGFRLITLDGRSTTLAHVNIHSPYQVSKYGVDIAGLERVGVFTLRQAQEQCELVVVDEIGKMELFSESFRQAVLDLIESGKRVLGTIMLGPHPWADAVKHKMQVSLVTVTRDNHAQVLRELQEWLQIADITSSY